VCARARACQCEGYTCGNACACVCDYHKFLLFFLWFFFPFFFFFFSFFFFFFLLSSANQSPFADFIRYKGIWHIFFQLLDTLPVCQDFNRQVCNRPACKFIHLSDGELFARIGAKIAHARASVLDGNAKSRVNRWRGMFHARSFLIIINLGMPARGKKAKVCRGKKKKKKERKKIDDNIGDIYIHRIFGLSLSLSLFLFLFSKLDSVRNLLISISVSVIGLFARRRK